MKKVILGAILLFSTLLSAQSVSLISNTTYGSNCGQNNTQNIIINGDLNLNGYTLLLRNVSLIVTGNLNGGGQIDFCGNRNNPSSSLCVNGTIQNNPNLNNLTCTTLDVKDFELEKLNLYKDVKIYDILGKYIGDKLSFLEKNTVYLVKVKGFKTRKIIIQ